ncbi:MAG: hypothetical protein JWQ35_1855 [Bacteriovoracaceae bacterium]|nr:hypothetical protein [Bacteriovoracaceae bacterium]
MKVLTVEAVNEEAAQVKLAQQLGVGLADLKFLRVQQKKFSFEVINCPATIEVEISRDGMKAILRRLSFPIGENVPRLDVNFIVEQLKKYGVTAGIKREVISSELVRILKTPGYDENTPLNMIVAEGTPPVAGSTGRPKWNIDLKLFEKNIPLYAGKGEVLAKAPHATTPKDGLKVTGEAVPATIDEQFKLNTGAGISVVRDAKEILYVAQSFGRLFYDQGIRLRLESKVVEKDDGMTGTVETGKLSITGQLIRAEDLLEMAKEQRVTVGLLPLAEVDLQLKTEKKWPAFIRVAKGKPSVDGSHGEVKFPFKQMSSTQQIDIQRAKLGIVFPGEIVAVIAPAKEPLPGQTIFGEKLRGKVCDDFPLYPGKNILRERVGNDTVFKTAIYGRVKQEKDRLLIENILSISADKMEANLDLFPQVLLTNQDILNLLREADILLTPNKEEMEQKLKEFFEKAQRVEKFNVIRGKAPQSGTDAKLVYRFNPEVFKQKGLFQKKAEVNLLAAPGDLLLTKIEPVEAQDGVDIYREKISVPATGIPKDIEIKSGDGVDEKEVGKEGDAQNPLRLEYRAASLGVITWKDRTIDVRSTLEFDKAEKFVNMSFASRSDFGTVMTEDVLKKLAEAEGIKVDLNWPEIKPVLSQKRSADGFLQTVCFAKAVEPKHGSNAVIQYFVDYNEKPVGEYLTQRTGKPPPPLSCDCVRPKDILASKKLPTNGEDGKTIFGRRLVADRGVDETWQFGEGVEKTPDGTQLVCSAKAPGFAFVDSGRLVVRSTVRIAPDKMSAKVSIYPTKNPRFPLREDKIFTMLTAAGVKNGIKPEVIREAISKALTLGELSIDLEVAEGVKPTRGPAGSFVLAMDAGSTVGEVRADGSVDFKDRNIFLSVKKGQLLLIKRPPGAGEEGFNVVGEKLPSILGVDQRMEALQGVEVSKTGLEYRAMIDGIVELKSKSVRVIAGLLIPTDVSFKTGHIEAGSADVIIKGSVLADFRVESKGEINVDNVAEACTIIGGGDVNIRGGVIGRDRGYVKSAKNMETIYITAGATVEVLGNLTVGTEVMNSQVRVTGLLTCNEGAGTIFGGEIWAYGGMKVKTLGSPGSETQTIVHLGEHFFEQKAAEAKIKDEKLNEKIAELEEKIKALNNEISEGFEAVEGETLKGNEVQAKYRVRIDEKQALQHQLDKFKESRDSLLNAVPKNANVALSATDMIYPGVTIIHRDIVWVLKEPQRGVEVRWNSATSNLISKRI